MYLRDRGWTQSRVGSDSEYETWDRGWRRIWITGDTRTIVYIAHSEDLRPCDVLREILAMQHVPRIAGEYDRKVRAGAAEALAQAKRSGHPLLHADALRYARVAAEQGQDDVAASWHLVALEILRPREELGGEAQPQARLVPFPSKSPPFLAGDDAERKLVKAIASEEPVEPPEPIPARVGHLVEAYLSLTADPPGDEETLERWRGDLARVAAALWGESKHHEPDAARFVELIQYFLGYVPGCPFAIRTNDKIREDFRRGLPERFR